MQHTEVQISRLATEVAESMREHRERDPREALKRVLNTHCIRLKRAGDGGGYERGSVASLILQELQRRSAKRARRNRGLGVLPKNREFLFPTSLFD
ncbi:MAG: hypothetical protein G01um1014107_371 [Parcubacteria group bacterium Gr01-1014_107]|nr:MAG: hypothetical protein G01um1014107_371 [Parcubacteria group bacterium Gr01-1014_107]